MRKFKLIIFFALCSILSITLYSQTVDSQFPYNLPLTTGDGLKLITFNGKDINNKTVSLPSFTGDGMMVAQDFVKNGFAGAYFKDLAFSTDKGFVIEFVYEFYTDGFSSLGRMGDGFALVLFDGSLSESQISIGSRGSGLGYAYNRTTAPVGGLTGGFLGIGFDVYGAFKNQGYSNTVDYRNGIYSAAGLIVKNFNGATSDFITIRGPVNPITTYGTNMAGYPTLYSQNTYNKSGGTLINAVLNPNWDTTSKDLFIKSYNFQSSTIESFPIAGGEKNVKYPNTSYRKVRIEMIPDPSTPGVSYINVMVTTDDAQNPIKVVSKYKFDENNLIKYPEVKSGMISPQQAVVATSMSMKSPKTLKLGWTAATGDAWANIILKDASVTLPYSPVVTNDVGRVCKNVNSTGTVNPLDNDYGYAANTSPTSNPVLAKDNISKTSFRFMVPKGNNQVGYNPNSNLIQYETSLATYTYDKTTGVVTAKTKVSVPEGTTENVYYDVTDKTRTSNDYRSKVATITFTFTNNVCSATPVADSPIANNDFASLCNTSASSTTIYPLSNDVGFKINTSAAQVSGNQYVDKSSFTFTNASGGATTVTKTATTISTTTVNATYTYTFSTGYLKIISIKNVADNTQESVYYTIKNTGGTSVSNVGVIRTSFVNANCPVTVADPPKLENLIADDVCKTEGTNVILDPLLNAVGYGIVNNIQESGFQYIDLKSFVFRDTGTNVYEGTYATYTFDDTTGLIYATVKSNDIPTGNEDGEYLYFTVINVNGKTRSNVGSLFVIFNDKNCEPVPTTHTGWIKINSMRNKSIDNITINGMGSIVP